MYSVGSCKVQVNLLWFVDAETGTELDSRHDHWFVPKFHGLELGGLDHCFMPTRAFGSAHVHNLAINWKIFVEEGMSILGTGYVKMQSLSMGACMVLVDWIEIREHNIGRCGQVAKS